uniref:Uncharacterized protein n=1 Tax=uncultured nuHF1 cluster bacterium HF0770_35I22 TaxID=723586 RepID=E7C7P5_9BACT|nr:hypothetical protein [uncultured nuHF1 cluster bacterium HF0770_35I22]
MLTAEIVAVIGAVKVPLQSGLFRETPLASLILLGMSLSGYKIVGTRVTKGH